MSQKKPFPLIIKRGATFLRKIRFEQLPHRYLPISAISQSAPCCITCPAHGVQPGQRVAVVSVIGMREINAGNPPQQSEYWRATVVDDDTLELNELNSADFSAYKGGGYVQCYTLLDVTGMTARMAFKDKIGGDEFFRLSSDNGGIVVSPTDQYITLHIDAVQSATLDKRIAVADLELVDASGQIVRTIEFAPAIRGEVTT